MADSASNQGKTIATKGTAHVARTFGPTDACIAPDMTVVPFENYVPTTRLAEGRTLFTKIDNHAIWTMKGEVGPLSDPVHPPHNKGAVSQEFYMQEANAAQGSPDVFAEGSPVVRTDDFTYQNAKNTSGYVDGSALNKASKSELTYLQKICAIVAFEGKCSHDGRGLGFPTPGGTGDPYYLEVLSGDTITFTAERHDTTQSPPEKEPKCRIGGDHTKWIATRTGSVPAVPPKTKRGTGTEFVVDGDMTDLSMSALLGLPSVGGAGGGSHTLKDDSAAGGATVSMSASSWISPMQWLLYWKIRENPPIITVQALACSGSKTATIKVFPDQGVSASLFAEQSDDTTKGFLAKIQKVKKIGEIVQKITRIAGHEIEIKFLVSPKVEFELEYVECTQQKGYASTIYTPARVNRKWSLTVGFDPLIGVAGKIKIPLMTFLPGLGPVMAKIINKINRKFPTFVADLVFSFSVSYSILCSVGRDEYDAPSSTGGKSQLSFELSMALELGLAGIKIKFDASFSGAVSLGFFLGDTTKVLLQLVLEGSLQSKFTITLFPDSWYEWEVASAEPEWLAWKPDAKRVDLIAAA